MLSLRQLEKVYTNISLFYAACPENYYRSVPIITFLAVIKIVNRPLFDRICQNSITYKEIGESIKFDQNKSKERMRWIMGWVRYTLLTEEQFKDLPANDEIKEYGQVHACYNIEREKIMYYFAQKLTIFNIK